MHAREELPSAGARWLDASAAPRLSVVFVHGWRGDYIDTWTHRKWQIGVPPRRSKKLLLDLLTADTELKANYFSVRHTGGLVLSRSSVKDLAKYLANFLQEYVYPQNTPIALISHSLGGLICRRAILDELDRLTTVKLPIVGILMFGTPNGGTSLARYPFTTIQKSTRDMQVDSEFLSDLNSEWTERVVNGGHPRYGVDRRTTLLAWYCTGSNDLVVKSVSGRALGGLGEWKPLEKDHVALPKAESNVDLTYVTIRSFLRACEVRSESRAIAHAAETVASEFRNAIQISDWTLDEEEHIRLSHATKQARDGALRCEISVRRNGGVASNIFKIAVKLEEVTAPDGPCDYNLIIGRGLLTDKAFGEIAAGIRPERLDHFVKVTQLTASYDGTAHSYARESVTVGPGYMILSFVAASLPFAVRRYSVLELALRTYISRHAGYYRYYSPRTVINKLVVDLRAPFQVSAIPLSYSNASVTRFPHGKDQVAQVTMQGPVVVNSRVLWVFGG